MCQFVYFNSSLFGTDQGGYQRALANHAIKTLDVPTKGLTGSALFQAVSEIISQDDAFCNQLSTPLDDTLLDAVGITTCTGRYASLKKINLIQVIFGIQDVLSAFKKVIKLQNEHTKFILNSHGAYFEVSGDIHTTALTDTDTLYQAPAFYQLVADTLEEDMATIKANVRKLHSTPESWQLTQPNGEVMFCPTTLSIEDFISQYEA